MSNCIPDRGYVGDKVALMYSTQPPSTAQESLVFVRLGMMTEKSRELTYNKIDATGDTSPEQYSEFIAGRKDGTLSGSYVCMGADIENQRAFEIHAENGSDETCNEPYFWFRLIYPSGKVYTGNYMIESISEALPMNDKVTQSFSASLNGAPTTTYS